MGRGNGGRQAWCRWQPETVLIPFISEEGRREEIQPHVSPVFVFPYKVFLCVFWRRWKEEEME